MSRLCRTFSQIGPSIIIISCSSSSSSYHHHHHDYGKDYDYDYDYYYDHDYHVIMIMTMIMVSDHHHEAARSVRGSVVGSSMDMWCPYGIGRESWDREVRRRKGVLSFPP